MKPDALLWVTNAGEPEEIARALADSCGTSVGASSHGGVTEPALTNWNGEFKGCLDYIFISSHFTAVEGSGKVVPRISTTAVETTGSLEDEEDPLEVPYGGVVTSHWPSDHFLVKTEIMFSHNE